MENPGYIVGILISHNVDNMSISLLKFLSSLPFSIPSGIPREPFTIYFSSVFDYQRIVIVMCSNSPSAQSFIKVPLNYFIKGINSFLDILLRLITKHESYKGNRSVFLNPGNSINGEILALRPFVRKVYPRRFFPHRCFVKLQTFQCNKIFFST